MRDPFVGRRVEQDILRRAIDGAARGRGAIVLIAGEPGIGKTRLAAVVAEHAELSGLTVRRAVCWEDAGAPFWPWVQLLRDDTDASAPAEVRRLVGAEVPGAPSMLGGDAEPVRLALFDAVTRYVAGRASQTPLLLTLDDLHWADVPSLRLLAYLSRTVRDVAVAVIGTFRDVELDRESEAGRLLRSVAEVGEVIRLDGLQTGEVAELLAASAGVLAPTEFARAVHERSGGNPLFVRELARLLAVSGRGAGDLASLPVPEGVHGVIGRRLARLSQPTQELLTVAAVFGSEFRADLVARASDTPKDLALDLLDAAVDARLVVLFDGSVGRYAFSHALVRDVLYGSIPPSRRAAMHLSAAEAIEASAPTGSHLAELAFHHLHGSLVGDVSRAIDVSVRAGRHALDQLAYEDAAAHFSRALSAMDDASDDERRTEVLLELGDARLRAGDLRAARDVFDEAATVARRRGRTDDLARAALGFGAGLAGFEIRLFDQRQIELLEEALGAVPQEDSPLRAALLARLTVALSMQESVERRLHVADEAIAMARRVGDLRSLAAALAAHCDAIAGPADAERRLDSSEEIVRLAREIDDRPLELLGRRLRIVALMEIGDFDAVDTEIERYASTVSGIRQPLYQWYVPLWRGMRSLMRGDFEQALASADEVDRVGDRAHSENARMLSAVQRFMIHFDRGRPDHAQEAALVMTELMPGYGNPYFALSDAWFYGAAGRLDDARSALRRLPDPHGAWIPVDSEFLPSMCQLAFAIAALDERDAAREAYDRLLPHRARFAIEGIGSGTHGSVEFHLGLYARTAGEVDTAVAHFERALDANRRIGARVVEARTLVELASTLVLRARHGDAQRAAELRSRAAAILHELGLQPDADPTGADRAGDAAPNAFRREGELWTLSFAGEVARMKDVKGAHDIAALLGRPGVEVAALDLVTERGASTRTDSETLGTPGHAGEVLDDEARERYKERLAELEEDIRDAEALGDPVRAERALEERDAIVKELSAAYGLGGRARRSGDPSERARTTVTRRIREAIVRIDELHPALGRHLRNSIRTGTYCSYVPEHAVQWDL